MEEEGKDNQTTPDETVNDIHLMEDIERFIERKKLENKVLKKMLKSIDKETKVDPSLTSNEDEMQKED
jgi:hypothetical protein